MPYTRLRCWIPLVALVSVFSVGCTDFAPTLTNQERSGGQAVIAVPMEVIAAFGAQAKEPLLPNALKSFGLAGAAAQAISESVRGDRPLVPLEDYSRAEAVRIAAIIGALPSQIGAAAVAIAPPKILVERGAPVPADAFQRAVAQQIENRRASGAIVIQVRAALTHTKEQARVDVSQQVFRSCRAKSKESVCLKPEPIRTFTYLSPVHVPEVVMFEEAAADEETAARLKALEERRDALIEKSPDRERGYRDKYESERAKVLNSAVTNTFEVRTADTWTAELLQKYFDTAVDQLAWMLAKDWGQDPRKPWKEKVEWVTWVDLDGYKEPVEARLVHSLAGQKIYELRNGHYLSIPDENALQGKENEP